MTWDSHPNARRSTGLADMPDTTADEPPTNQSADPELAPSWPREGRSRGKLPVGPPDPGAAVRVAERRAAQRQFRLYCVACGRSSVVANPPAHPGRCETCGGTMLTELDGG